MKIERQTELRKVLSPVALPKMAVIEQHFPDDAIQDVPAYLRERLMPEHIRSRIQPGMKVVLTGSSRQIHDMPVVLRELASFVKAQGAQPYIIPAMGSHAGGIAEKQKELLEGYGITEAFCGCPIYSSMETVQALLAQGIVPDGIVCGEDLTAAGALKALLRAGLRVPGQVAIVGFNNSDYAHLCEPVLTSVDNKPEQVALLCVQLLESSIERSEAYSSVVLQPELAQGETS